VFVGVEEYTFSVWMVSALHTVSGVVYAVAFTGTAFWFGYVLARRFVSNSSISTRWAAALTISFAEFVVAMHGLSAVSSFQRHWAVALLALLGGGAHVAFDGNAARATLRADVSAGWSAVRRLGMAPRVLLAACALLVGARLYRGLVAPPMGQDSIVYHLLRAGRWVQSGTIGWEDAPDVWRFIEAYPPAGDAVSAWAMLATHDDRFVGVAGVVPWLICLIGAHALARSLGAGTDRAFMAAGLVGSCPALCVYVTSAYSDSVVLGMFLVSAVFAGRASQSGARVDALLCGLSLGIAASVKYSAFAWLAVALLVVVAGVAIRRRTALAPAFAALWILAGASIACFGMARSFTHTGSPIYPFGLQVFGIHWPSDALFKLITSAKLYAPTDLPHWYLPRILFTPGFWKGRDETGLGPTAILLLPAAIVAAKAAWRQTVPRAAIVFLALSTAVMVVGLSTPGMAAYRTGFAIHLGRFVTAGAAAVFVLACAGPSRWARWICLVGLTTNVVLSLPRGWCELDAISLWSAAPAAIAIATPAAIFLPQIARARPWLRRGVAASSVAVSLLGWIGLQQERDAVRYEYYARAGASGCFDAHVLTRSHTAAWPVWRQLDGILPLRIAASGGWDGLGGFWARYPLLGSSLQNEVVYIPPTKDGAVVDYRNADLPKFDFKAWLRRLLERRVEVFVSLPPLAPEHMWVRQHTDIFELFAVSADDKTHAYRFNADAARAWVR
jgi:hypothetical protein